MGRRLRIEPKVIQCAPANRVGVLVLRECFTAPFDVFRRLINAPRGATVTLVHECAIVCPAGFLGRRVKSNVANVDAGEDGHLEVLNAVIEVLIENGIFIVPDSVIWPRHLIANEENPIVSRIRLVLSYRCTRGCPSHDGRLHSPSHAHRRKGEIRCAANKELTVRSIVIHVALPRMDLTPLVLLRCQVCRFREIGCALIERCVQITDINANPMRRAVMYVAGVVARRIRRRPGWENPGKRINPRARTKQVVPSVLGGEIRIGTART